MNKKARDRLLQNKPHVRPVTEDDLKWIYTGAVLKGAPRDRDVFNAMFYEVTAKYDDMYVIEDENKQFQSGRDVVALMSSKYDGWIHEPKFTFMPWATPRNKMRCVISGVLFCKYSKDFGVSLFHVEPDDVKFAERMLDYVKFYKLGEVPGGLPEGTDTIYYIRGKKSNAN